MELSSLRVVQSAHSYSSTMLAMLRIIQVLTLSSLIRSSFAVTAYLFDVRDCPSTLYVSASCSNIAENDCCTDPSGVRSICFCSSHLSNFPYYNNSIIFQAQSSSISETTSLSCRSIPTVMANVIRDYRESAKSVSRHVRITFWV